MSLCVGSLKMNNMWNSVSQWWQAQPTPPSLYGSTEVRSTRQDGVRHDWSDIYRSPDSGFGVTVSPESNQFEAKVMQRLDLNAPSQCVSSVVIHPPSPPGYMSQREVPCPSPFVSAPTDKISGSGVCRSVPPSPFEIRRPDNVLNRSASVRTPHASVMSAPNRCNDYVSPSFRPVSPSKSDVRVCGGVADILSERRQQQASQTLVDHVNMLNSPSRLHGQFVPSNHSTPQEVAFVHRHTQMSPSVPCVNTSPRLIDSLPPTPFEPKQTQSSFRLESPRVVQPVFLQNNEQPNPMISHAPEYSHQRFYKKEPRKFNGKDDLNDYLLYFARMIKLNNWPYDIAGLQLATSLEGDAASVLSRLRNGLSEDYHEICRALWNKYYPSGSEGRFAFDFLNRVRKSNETPVQFGEALVRLASHAFPCGNVPEQLLVNLFAKGLADEEATKYVYLAMPQTLEQAVHLACTYDAYHKSPMCDSSRLNRKPKSEGVNVVKGSQSPPSKISKEEEALFQKWKEWMNKERKLKDKSNVECYSCHERGHYANECPMKEKASKKPKSDVLPKN